ncbi:MAG: TRAP transporter large permease subunit, partial [Herbaspirillum sp.]
MSAVHSLPSGAALGRQDAPRSVIDSCQHWLQKGVESFAALVLVAEVVILMAGIVARSVLHSSLIWSDELASILFLWLAMLGSALAVQKNCHMRLSFFVSKLSPRMQVWTETLAVAVTLVMLALLLHPSIDYVEDQGFVETPALGWSGMVRALALPVGFAVALASCGLRLLQHGKRDLLIVTLLLALIAAACYLGVPLLTAMGQRALPVFFLGMLGLAVMAGAPIAFAFAMATSAYLLCTTSTPLVIVVGRMDEGMSSLILLAVPMFVLLGQLVHATGLARVMVEFLASLVGHVRGGMSYVLLGAMLLVSGISGSKTADMAAVAPVLFPEMRKRGVQDSELISLLAASGAMSETIPPSLVLIAIASVTGISIAA